MSAVTTRIVGGHWIYTGSEHAWARGRPVEIVAVHRGRRRLVSDEAIGRLRDGDVVEFKPLARHGRPGWVRGDATRRELGAIVAVF